jgi:hypothetical protein
MTSSGMTVQNSKVNACTDEFIPWKRYCSASPPNVSLSERVCAGYRIRISTGFPHRISAGHANDVTVPPSESLPTHRSWSSSCLSVTRVTQECCMSRSVSFNLEWNFVCMCSVIWVLWTQKFFNYFGAHWSGALVCVSFIANDSNKWKLLS